VPGRFFAVPLGLSRGYADRLGVQQRAAGRFEPEVLKRLGLRAGPSGVAVGGWQGATNPSGQLALRPDTPLPIVLACMGVLGLLWRQDGVAMNRVHPDGRRAATLVGKADGTAFTPVEFQHAYAELWAADVDRRATIGFVEVGGAMLFINGGPLADDQFRGTIRQLVTDRLPGDFRLVQTRADFELIETDWSNGDGEDYRRAIRDAGRPDLLDWLDGGARREAEAFLEEEAGGASGQG
jgi:hypothetical protein